MTAAGRRAATTTAKVQRDDAFESIVARIQSEYREMPGLRLTLDQMRRLWMLERQTCLALIDKLVNARFLMRTSDGRYVRSDFRRPMGKRRNHQEV